MRKLSPHEPQTSRSTSRDSGHDQIVAQLRSQVGLAVAPDPSPGILLRQHLGELVLDQAPRRDTDAKAFQCAFQLTAVPVQLISSESAQRVRGLRDGLSLRCRSCHTSHAS